MSAATLPARVRAEMKKRGLAVGDMCRYVVCSMPPELRFEDREALLPRFQRRDPALAWLVERESPAPGEVLVVTWHRGIGQVQRVRVDGGDEP